MLSLLLDRCNPVRSLSVPAYTSLHDARRCKGTRCMLIHSWRTEVVHRGCSIAGPPAVPGLSAPAPPVVSAAMPKKPKKKRTRKARTKPDFWRTRAGRLTALPLPWPVHDLTACSSASSSSDSSSEGTGCTVSVCTKGWKITDGSGRDRWTAYGVGQSGTCVFGPLGSRGRGNDG